MQLSVAGEIFRRYKQQEQLMDWFAPLPYQVDAFNSTKKIQMFEGGNRSGKTELAIAKVIQIARGKHPTVKRKLPVKIRIVATVLTHGALGTILNKIRKLIPIKELKGGSWEKGYHGERMTITFLNKSTIQLMADTQDVQYHRGEDLDVVLIDEECREEIFDENLTRLADREGLMILSMTPHKGLTWSYKKIVKKRKYDPQIDYFHFNVVDNYTFNREAYIRSSAKLFSEREFRIRILGERIALEGLVFSTFDESTHLVKPFNLPEGTQLFLGVDFGYNNPHAGSLRAILPRDTSVDGVSNFIVSEYYESGYTVSENARSMGKWIREKYPTLKLSYVVCDPRSGSQTQRQTGEKDIDVFRKNFWDSYGKRVPVRMGRTEKGCVEHRINIVNEEFTPDLKGQIKLKMFSNCYHHLDEIENYIYPKRKDEDMNQHTKPKETKNHLMDALEYVAEQKPKHLNVIRMKNYSPYQYDRVGR